MLNGEIWRGYQLDNDSKCVQRTIHKICWYRVSIQHLVLMSSALHNVMFTDTVPSNCRSRDKTPMAKCHCPSPQNKNDPLKPQPPKLKNQ